MARVLRTRMTTSADSEGTANGGGSETPWFEKKLTDLKSLYDRGLLDQTVYEAKQQEVVDAMVSMGTPSSPSPGSADPRTDQHVRLNDLMAETLCQYDGKGKFLPVCVELSGRGKLCFKSSKDGSVVRMASVIDCSAGRPKSARKGHPHALRLDVVETEAQAAGKFVFSMGSAAELAVWLERLGQFAEGAGPLLQPQLSSAAAAAAAADWAGPAGVTESASASEVSAGDSGSGSGSAAGGAERGAGDDGGAVAAPSWVLAADSLCQYDGAGRFTPAWIELSAPSGDL